MNEQKNEQKLDPTKIQRLQDLIDGKATAPNEFAAHLINEARKVGPLLQNGYKQLELITAKKAELEGQVKGLEGALSQLMGLLVTWDRQIKPPTDPMLMYSSEDAVPKDPLAMAHS